jgi:hypothetical protein
MSFNFLTNLVLEDTRNTKVQRKTLPQGLTIRVYANGSVYPSQELIDKFNLEYPLKKDMETNPGNGFDLIDSSEWTPTKNYPRVILLGLVPRSEPKVDLFSLARYDEEGKPKASVLTQGTVSANLLDMVRSLGYLTEGQRYCDLKLEVDKPITLKDGIAFVPKVVEKGDRKGEATYERREDIVIYHAVPQEVLDRQPEAGEEPVSTETKITHE